MIWSSLAIRREGVRCGMYASSPGLRIKFDALDVLKKNKFKTNSPGALNI